MNLEDLGHRPMVEAAWTALDPQHELILARLSRVDGQVAHAWTADGLVRAGVAKTLRHSDRAPVAGDWGLLNAGADVTRLQWVLPRQSQIVRRAAGRRAVKQVLVANVDIAFVVVAMDENFSERRIERYATIVHESGARPILVLTKAGLTDAREAFVARATKAAPGLEVLAVDVLAGIEADAVAACLSRGTTAVLLGSSGVGKSTLVNHLLGHTAMPTGDVRQHDGQGQHTTSHRELFALATGGVVIDTPGLREVALWVDPSSVDHVFADIDTLASGCSFGDCTHGPEPGCAVAAALVSGELDRARLDSYRSLRDEAERTAAQMPEHERRKHDRKLGKMYREVQRGKRGRR